MLPSFVNKIRQQTQQLLSQGQIQCGDKMRWKPRSERGSQENCRLWIQQPPLCVWLTRTHPRKMRDEEGKGEAERENCFLPVRNFGSLSAHVMLRGKKKVLRCCILSLRLSLSMLVLGLRRELARERTTGWGLRREERCIYIYEARVWNESMNEWANFYKLSPRDEHEMKGKGWNWQRWWFLG